MSIAPELKEAWKKTDDIFRSLLSGRQKMSFSKVLVDGDLCSLEPISPAATLSKPMILDAIPEGLDKEHEFIMLVHEFKSNTKSVVSSVVDKDLDGTQHFHRSSIKVEDTAEKLVLTGVKLEK